MMIRGEKIMIDRDLAELYGVDTKQLKRAVRRNADRFPSDFMFEITREEYNSLRGHFGTLKRGTHSKYLPMAFTEQGVAMLSSVLNSARAIEVNKAIMKISSSQKQLPRKLQEIEAQLEDHNESIEAIFEAIRQLMSPPEKSRKKIGFEVKEAAAVYSQRSKRKKFNVRN